MMAVLGAITDEVVLLHCLSEYPTALDDMHLRMIPALRSRYGCPTGLSDHSRNIPEIAASVALGCAMIEVHFTFDRQAKGPDHHVSLLPAEMAELVGAVRNLGARARPAGEGARCPRPGDARELHQQHRDAPGDPVRRDAEPGEPHA